MYICPDKRKAKARHAIRYPWVNNIARRGLQRPLCTDQRTAMYKADVAQQPFASATPIIDARVAEITHRATGSQQVTINIHRPNSRIPTFAPTREPARIADYPKSPISIILSIKTPSGILPTERLHPSSDSLATLKSMTQYQKKVRCSLADVPKTAQPAPPVTATTYGYRAT